MAGWHHQLDGHEFELRKLVMDNEAWRAVIHGVAKSWTWLSDWTELNWTYLVTWSQLTLILGSDKNSPPKVNCTPISLPSRFKIPQENISKLNPTIHKKNYTHWLSGLYFRYTGLVYAIYHVNRIKKKKNHWVISIGMEKAKQIQYLFTIKTLNKLGMERTSTW